MGFFKFFIFNILLYSTLSAHAIEFQNVNNFDVLEQEESYDQDTLIIFDVDKVLFVLTEPTDRESKRTSCCENSLFFVES